MKIVHFADVHIGVENYGRTDPETGLSTRLLDFLKTFDEVVDYALSERVDLVLFCGDAYKSRDPTQTHQREFAKRVARLSSEGIPVFLLTGNHDMPHVTARATALEIFRTLDVSNVYPADRLETHRIRTRSGPIQVVSVPWIRRSQLLTTDDTRGLNPEQVNELIQQRLTDVIRVQAQALDPDVPAILAGHVTVSEAVTSSEQSMLLGREHVLLKSSVALPEFDYVALGHIHKHQVLNEDPKVAYAGSLQRIDFGELGDEKGFCVVDLDPSRPRGLRLDGFEFTPVDARRFLSITVDVSPNELDPTRTVISAIQQHDVDGAIVRLLIRLKEQEPGLREVEIRQALEGAHFVAAVSREVEQQHRDRLGGVDASGLSPLDALKLYLEGRDLSEERARLLQDRARELVAEEAEQD